MEEQSNLIYSHLINRSYTVYQKIMKQLKLTLALFIIFFSSEANNNPDKSLRKFKKQAEIFAKDPSLKTASWGFTVYNVMTGEEIISVNPDLSLIPASTLKIVTTGAALNILGKDFRYETLLEYTGKIDDTGVLHGNIYIKGSGDPTFGSPHMNDTKPFDEIFSNWIDSVQKLGTKEINGKVIADESVFDNELVPREWTWEDVGNYYGAGSSGLTIRENKYTVYFEPDLTPGKPARVLKTDPPMPWIGFINQVNTAEPNTGDNVYILGSPYSNTRWLTGTVPAGIAEFGVRGSMPDPAYFCARHFNDLLVENGIQISEEPTTSRIIQESYRFEPQERYTLARHLSPPLEKIVERVNTHSVNTYAENLLKTIGLNKQGEGSTKAGIKSVKEFWSNEGIDIQGLYMHDGSGLAQKNRITPQQLTDILVNLANGPQASPFLESLAVGGRTGTLSHLFGGDLSQDNLIAKSGFLSNVIGYAGYTNTKNNEFLVFVLIVNDYDGPARMMRNKMIKLLDNISHLN